MATTNNYGFILGPNPPNPLKKSQYDYNWNLLDSLLLDLNNRITSMEDNLPVNYALVNLSNVSSLDILNKVKSVDGPGSGLDADTLDGYQSSVNPQPNSIPVSDSNGYLNSWINQGPGSGLDADTLDGYHADSFLRRDGLLPMSGQLALAYPRSAITGFDRTGFHWIRFTTNNDNDLILGIKRIGANDYKLVLMSQGQTEELVTESTLRKTILLFLGG